MGWARQRHRAVPCHGCWNLLQSQGITDTGGDIWLQTYPRVWGYSFKPVSFWYCFDDTAKGRLRAVVAEVNNTFGERHCYVLHAPTWGETITADKVFHVSPFCEVQGHYAFCFTREERGGAVQISARVDYHDAQGLLFAHPHWRHPAGARQGRAEKSRVGLPTHDAGCVLAHPPAGICAVAQARAFHLQAHPACVACHPQPPDLNTYLHPLTR